MYCQRKTATTKTRSGMKTIEYKLQLIIDDTDVKRPDDLKPYGEAFVASAIADRIKDRPQDLVKAFGIAAGGGRREITPSAAATGSEIPWGKISAFVERLVKEPRGQRRAANLIREIAAELSKVEACEDLANASQEVQRMLVRSWENRWEKSRGAESQNAA